MQVSFKTGKNQGDSGTKLSQGANEKSVQNKCWLAYLMEKETATHSSVLAWRIPGTGEAGGLPSKGSHPRTEEPGRRQPMGSQRVGHD